MSTVGTEVNSLQRMKNATVFEESAWHGVLELSDVWSWSSVRRQRFDLYSQDLAIDQNLVTRLS